MTNRVRPSGGRDSLHAIDGAGPPTTTTDPADGRASDHDLGLDAGNPFFPGMGQAAWDKMAAAGNQLATTQRARILIFQPDLSIMPARPSSPPAVLARRGLRTLDTHPGVGSGAVLGHRRSG